MDETENESNNEKLNLSSEQSHEKPEENQNSEIEKNLEDNQNLEENIEQQEEVIKKEDEIEQSLKEDNEKENLRYQNEEELNEENKESNEEKEEDEEEKENEEEVKEGEGEEKEKKEEKENEEEVKEGEEKESQNYIENIQKNHKVPKNKRLPKIMKFAKSLTENSIQRITTNASENKKDNIYSIMYKKVLDFNAPKIRNNHYNNIKTMNNVFLQKKKEYEKQNKLYSLKGLTEEEFEKEKLERLEKMKNPFKLTDTETRKYLDLYNYDGMKENIQDLKNTQNQKNYKSMDFNTTRYSDSKAFNIFYSKMRRDNEIIRKGGINLKTPSFNLISSA